MCSFVVDALDGAFFFALRTGTLLSVRSRRLAYLAVPLRVAVTSVGLLFRSALWGGSGGSAWAGSAGAPFGCQRRRRAPRAMQETISQAMPSIKWPLCWWFWAGYAPSGLCRLRQCPLEVSSKEDKPASAGESESPRLNS